MKKFTTALKNRDIDVVKRRKIWYIIPAAIVIFAIIMGIVHSFRPGGRGFLNVAIDFSGGYAMTLRLSHRLTDETLTHYEDQIISIAEGLGLSVRRDEIFEQGEGANASLYFRFTGIRPPEGDTRSQDEFMEYLQDLFEEELSALFAFAPIAITTGVAAGTFVVEYDENINQFLTVSEEGVSSFATAITAEIIRQGNSQGLTISNNIIVTSNEAGTFFATFTAEGASLAENQAAMLAAFTLADPFSGRVDRAGMTSAVMGTELLIYGLLMIALAFILKLVYIAFRFDLAAGTSAVTGLLHDLIMMFSFMIIAHIPIGVTFIAALITIMGYSLNNSFILFDRVKEKTKPYGSKEYNTKLIANQAAGDTLFRSFATTITGLFPIIAIAIGGLAFGVPSIAYFALPIIIGLVSGTYSTLTILPTTWVSIKNIWFKRQKAKGILAPQDQLIEAEVIIPETAADVT